MSKINLQNIKKPKYENNILAIEVSTDYKISHGFMTVQKVQLTLIQSTQQTLRSTERPALFGHR